MLITSSQARAYQPGYQAVRRTETMSTEEIGFGQDQVVLSSGGEEGPSSPHPLQVASLALIGFSAGGLIGCFIPSGGAGPVICLGMMGALLATQSVM